MFYITCNIRIVYEIYHFVVWFVLAEPFYVLTKLKTQMKHFSFSFISFSVTKTQLPNSKDISFKGQQSRPILGFQTIPKVTVKTRIS